LKPSRRFSMRRSGPDIRHRCPEADRLWRMKRIGAANP
jgi:hypothetical protein